MCASSLSSAPSNTFVEVRPNLWRYNGEFAFIPSPAQRTPVAFWLVEAKSAWILIDTGAASPEYAEPFLAALKQKLSASSNPLRVILRESSYIHLCLCQYALWYTCLTASRDMLLLSAFSMWCMGSYLAALQSCLHILLVGRLVLLILPPFYLGSLVIYQAAH